MGSLLDSINNSISSDLIRSVAETVGETADGARNGVEIAAATILGALAGKAHDSGFMSQVTSLVNSYGSETSGAATGTSGTATQAADEARARFLKLLFGSNQAAVEDKIAQAAGISSGAGSGVLSSAAPLVLSSLASRQGDGVSGLSRALTNELDSIRSLIPAGLPGVHLAHLTGTTAASREAALEKAKGGWVWPVLLLGALLIGALVWYFNRETSVKKPVETAAVATKDATTTARAAISDATKAAWAKLGELFKRKLPGGLELSIPRLGVENRLVDWLESSKPVDDSTWFDFDRLLFDTGSATLEPASQEQLGNIADILKAYPKVKIKLGGFTDNTGEAAANLQLSEARAKNVMAELVKLGVEPSRMEAQGYGAEQPVADNNTELGRQLNRRISLRVTQK